MQIVDHATKNDIFVYCRIFIFIYQYFLDIIISIRAFKKYISFMGRTIKKYPYFKINPEEINLFLYNKHHNIRFSYTRCLKSLFHFMGNFYTNTNSKRRILLMYLYTHHSNKNYFQKYCSKFLPLLLAILNNPSKGPLANLPFKIVLEKKRWNYIIIVLNFSHIYFKSVAYFVEIEYCFY